MAKFELNRIDPAIAGIERRLSALEDAQREGDGTPRRVWWDASPLCDLRWAVWRTDGFAQVSATLSPVEAEPGVWYEAVADGDEMELTVRVESGLRSARTKRVYDRATIHTYSVVEFEFDLQEMYRHCCLDIDQQRRKAQDRAEGLQ